MSMLLSDSAPLPSGLADHRRGGNYRGAYGSLAELGNVLRPVLRITAGLSRRARIRVAVELHIRGDLWTVMLDGLVHVFGMPGSDADALLVAEHRWSDPAEPRTMLTPVDSQEATTAA